MSHGAHVDRFVRDRLPPRDSPHWPALIGLDELGYPPRLNAATALLAADEADLGNHRTALIGVRRSWSRRELAAAVDRCARALVEGCMLRPGERVLLRAANRPELVVLWLAVIKSGAVAVTTMPLLRRAELERIVAKARINLAICERSLGAELDALNDPGWRELLWLDELRPLAERRQRPGRRAPFAAVDTAADDPCLLAFTSGTTGEPKAAVHTHRDLLAVCDTFGRRVLRPRPDDIFIGSPPLAFTFGLGGLLLFPLRAGAATVMLEHGSPALLARAIERHRATVCFSAPTAYRQMLALDDAGPSADLSSLRRCVAGGEPVSKATSDAWFEKTGLRLIDGMGSTEMLHIFITAADDAVRPGATGKPVPLYQARIVDEHMNELPDGEVGRLAVRGPTGCRYLDDPRQRDYVRDGWNLTGDAFVRDRDGYFWFQSRADDMIVSAGYNIAGPEVEAALLGHAAVAECAAVAAPDAERGHIVKAFVVLRPGFAPGAVLAKELQDFVKNAIAPYKYPRAVEFLERLPRTETGKIRRYILRERERSRGADGDTP